MVKWFLLQIVSMSHLLEFTYLFYNLPIDLHMLSSSLNLLLITSHVVSMRMVGLSFKLYAGHMGASFAAGFPVRANVVHSSAKLCEAINRSGRLPPKKLSFGWEPSRGGVSLLNLN